MSAANSFSQKILLWYRKHGRRDLPWQQQRTPYRVWVSEIMLQQTQVSTVIPYFERFMQHYPDVFSLAASDEDSLLHLWTGLGYYSRARNLHKTARIVCAEYGGEFPASVEALSKLPGIGRSTAAAIVSQAFNKQAAILDGNVKRVLCRYHGIEGWPDQSSTLKQLWVLAEKHAPERNCRDYTQAIMDLGATVCRRSKPGCPACPLQAGCSAYRQELTAELPTRKPRKTLPVKSTQMLMLQSPDRRHVLLEKRPPQGIWGGLWSFPEIPAGETADSFLQHHAPGIASTRTAAPALRHTFSHFHLDIQPLAIALTRLPGSIMENDRWHWYDLKKPRALGLARPVATLLAQLEQAL